MRTRPVPFFHKLLFVFGLFGYLLGIQYVATAQPKVTLLADPDVETIKIGGELKEVTFITRTDSPDVEFFWELEGQGELQDELDKPSVTYLVPDEIEEDRGEVKVKVTVTDDDGRKVHKEIILKLISGSIPEYTEEELGKLRVILRGEDMEEAMIEKRLEKMLEDIDRKELRRILEEHESDREKLKRLLKGE